MIRVMEQDIGDVIGVCQQEPAVVLKDLARIRSQQLQQLAQFSPKQEGEHQGGGYPTDEEIVSAIESRNEARKKRDFSTADTIRKGLEARGVILKDSASGTTWEYR
jgi:cysteinyl-tRNA synthetase